MSTQVLIVATEWTGYCTGQTTGMTSLISDADITELHTHKMLCLAV